VVKGLKDIKEWGICHGDLKPENIMIRAQNPLESGENISRTNVSLSSPGSKSEIAPEGSNDNSKSSDKGQMKMQAGGNSPSKSTKELVKFKHQFLDKFKTPK
jgi:serine/threonine protein kinase